MRILLEKTDEEHPLAIAEIIEELAAYNIRAERKSLYSDFELLRQFGLDIETQRSNTTRYYIAQRQFELPELKLLVDAAQSCRFISKKKSEVLIKKLSSLTSTEQAKQLRRQVYISDRVKTINESVYYNIDRIHYAINNKKKITFKYFDYDESKKQIFRKQGNLYKATPAALCWNEDKYYLITYTEHYDSYTHYRVDRMSAVTALEENGDKIDKSKFNIAQYTKRVFGMFNGEIVRARLSFDNSYANVVFDHFGKDVRIISADGGWFDILADVSVSPVFFAWIFTFGDKAKIKEPENLIAEMKLLIGKIKNQYSD